MSALGTSLLVDALGGDEEVRTPDPLRARQVLSQLSYTPIGLRLLFPEPSKLNNDFDSDFL